MVKKITQKKIIKRRPVGNKLNHHRGSRPWVWQDGPDPSIRRQRRAWNVKKCQAKFRDEGWKFPFSDFRKAWNGNWHLAGRHVWLCRKDNSKPWCLSNVRINIRSDHFKHVNKNYNVEILNKRKEKNNAKEKEKSKK